MVVREQNGYRMSIREDSDSDPQLFDEILGEADHYGVHGRSDVKVVVDVGANIGSFVILVNRLYPDARIIAYEPEQDNYKLLRENIDLNEIKVTCYQQAVSSEMSFVEISAREGLTHVCDNGPMCQQSLCTHSVQTVEAITLGQALPTQEDIDILKVDTEGSEYAIFTDVAKWLMERIRYICLEIHDYFGDDARNELWNKLNETHLMVEREFRPGSGGIWTGERR